MTEDYSETPMVDGGEEKKNNTPLIIAIVVVVLLCCCCSLVATLWQFGDPIMEILNDLAFQSIPAIGSVFV